MWHTPLRHSCPSLWCWLGWGTGGISTLGPPDVEGGTVTIPFLPLEGRGELPLTGPKTTLCSCLVLSLTQLYYSKGSLPRENVGEKSLSLTRPSGDSLCLSSFPCNPQPGLAFFPSLLCSSSFKSCPGLGDESLAPSLKGSNPLGLFSNLIDVYIY